MIGLLNRPWGVGRADIRGAGDVAGLRARWSLSGRNPIYLIACIKAIVINIMISGATMMIANLALGHLIPRSVPFIFAVLLFCATAGTSSRCAA